jgi:hypothetical protein
MPLLPPQAKIRKDKANGGGISDESVATTNAITDESNATSDNTVRTNATLNPPENRLVVRILATVALEMGTSRPL